MLREGEKAKLSNLVKLYATASRETLPKTSAPVAAAGCKVGAEDLDYAIRDNFWRVSRIPEDKVIASNPNLPKGEI